MLYTDPGPGINNSEKMDFDPVLDLYPVQDPSLELKTTGKSGQLFFTSWWVGELSWTAMVLKQHCRKMFFVCFLGIPVFLKMIFRNSAKFSL